MPTVPYNNELPKKYNPQNTPPEVLKNTFSIRLKEYEKIRDDITQATMDTPEQHYIIQGVRGSGKTTLLTRLNLAIEDDAALSERLIPVQLNEEEYGINNLFSLWLHIAEELENSLCHASLFSGLTETIESIEENENFEAETAFKKINHSLNQHNKKLIIFIDNIAELFDHFTPKEKALLREILSQNNNVRIIGGSAIALEFFYNHQDPFYQFFKVITLKKLTKKETINLLLTLGKTAGKVEYEKIKKTLKEQPEKVESIRRLTGGIPRTIALLFDILAEGPQGKTFQYLDHVLDMASPIYKHRMDDLSAQQKPIINAIAKNWDAISAKEIAEKTRISSKNISAQLAQLQKQWLVEKIPTNTKNNLYRLQERFFNIWYLMRYGRRRDKMKMRWLTQFLELWCTPEEMSHRAKQFSDELHTNTYLPGSVAYTSALLGCKNINIKEKEAIHHHAHTLLSQQGMSALLKQLPDISSSDYINQALIDYNNNKFNDAIESLTKAAQKGSTKAHMGIAIIHHYQLNNINMAKTHYLEAIKHGNNGAYLNIGNMYCDNLNDFEQAEKYYLKAIEHNEIGAYFNIGSMYCDNLNDFEQAEKYYLKAIEHNEIGTFINMGNMYCDNLNDFEQAEKYYLKAIEYNDFGAYLNMGNMYCNNLNDFEQAEKYYLKAIEYNDFGAYLNMGNMYCNNLNDFEQAEKYYLKAIEHNDFGAYINMGNMYCNNLNDFEQAEKYYLKAIEYNDFGAYINMGNMYRNNLNDFEQAEKYYLQSIEHNINDAYINLGHLYYLGMNNVEQAEKCYLLAIEHNIDNAFDAIPWLYFETIQTSKQKTALNYAKESVQCHSDFNNNHTLASVALWNNEITLAKQTTVALLQLGSWKENPEEQAQFVKLLLLFLAKDQTHLVEQWLEKYDLKDRFMPLYYTLMHLIKDKYPNEYLRMGSEMEETVQEMLNTVEKLRTKYA